MANKTLEERVTALERKLDTLAHAEAEAKAGIKPWWEPHFGAFRDSPYYDAAMRRGREYRESQPTAVSEDDPNVPAGY